MSTEKLVNQLAKISLITLSALTFTVSGFAAPSPHDGPDYAYDANPSYKKASHSNRTWQRLGTYNRGNTYGVSWRVGNGTDSDWGSWGHDELYVGQSIQFQFNMFKYKDGNHYADHLKAWVDWGQDGKFNNSDTVIYKESVVNETYQPHRDRTVWSTEIFESDTFVANNTGDLWLRARVTCSESLASSVGGNWNSQWTKRMKKRYEDIFAATGNYYQGEVEEWKLKVNAVPEPATIILFGFGLIGLAHTGRARNS